jgi:uncharacterized phage protein (TIGR01671 family)
MREIKFRAWDKESNQMEYAEEMHGGKEVYFDFRGNCFKLMQHMEEDYPREVDAVIMQYVGIKDKNGKEIYEGDIVRLIGQYNRVTINEVVFTNTSFCLRFDTGDCCLLHGGSSTTEIKNTIESIEVIGNIYEDDIKKLK